MQLQQTGASTKRDAMTDGVRYLARELIREPVKEAVREALREEADVRASEQDGRSAPTLRPEDRSDRGDDGGSGGPSMRLVILGLAAAAGAVYAARKRGGGTEQSTWSEFDEQSGSGTDSTEFGRESDSSEPAGTAGMAAGESSSSTME